MHYALSHREDTKYWRDINNRSFYDERLTDQSIKADVLVKMSTGDYMRSDSGHHVVGVGLRYFGFDVFEDNLSQDEKFKIKLREKQVEEWDTICKTKPKLLQFLKDNIHNGSL